ncbi:MAG: hypothetical protein M3Y05_02325 [Gemmatimonadota bacterium]|nr:hypothetical protein [Gemmatimonadota bacterium]
MNQARLLVEGIVRIGDADRDLDGAAVVRESRVVTLGILATPEAFEAAPRLEVAREQRAQAGVNAITASLAKKAKADRDAQFRAAVVEAKRIVGAHGNAAAVVAAYRHAAELGLLDVPSSKEYALELKARGDELVAAKDYSAAVPEFQEARRRDATVPGIDESIATATKLLARAQTSASIQMAIDVAKGPCDNSDAIVTAWNEVRQISKDDEQHDRVVKVVGGLERCRKTAYQSTLQQLRKEAAQNRQTYADKAERNLLDKGMDVHIYLGGAS